MIGFQQVQILLIFENMISPSMKKNKKINSLYIIVIALLICTNVFAQCGSRITGIWYSGTSPVQIIDSCNGSGNVTFYVVNSKGGYIAYGIADTVANVLTYYFNIEFKPNSATWHETGMGGSISLNWDTITGNYEISDLGADPEYYTDIYTRTPTGINNINNTIQTKSWPNPVTSSLYFTINSTDPEVDVKVFNLVGECVYAETLKTYNAEYNINTENLSNGMYILQISSGQYQTNTKFVKQ